MLYLYTNNFTLKMNKLFCFKFQIFRFTDITNFHDFSYLIFKLKIKIYKILAKFNQ
jgi:hypothetical protein